MSGCLVWLGRLLDGRDQSFHVVLPAHIADLEGISSCQVDKRFGQLLSTWHLRPLYQRRNNADSAFQSRLNLQANQILAVIQSTPAAGVRKNEPTLADDSDHHVA